MTAPPLPPEQGVSARFLYEQIMQFIAACRTDLDAGREVALDGLDKKMLTLCDAVQRMSPDNARVFGEHLEEVMAEVTALEAALKSTRDTVADELARLRQHRKANSAYASIETLGKKE